MTSRDGCQHWLDGSECLLIDSRSSFLVHTPSGGDEFSKAVTTDIRAAARELSKMFSRASMEFGTAEGDSERNRGKRGGKGASVDLRAAEGPVARGCRRVRMFVGGVVC